VVDYVRYWSERTGISYRRIVQWVGIPRSKFYQWQERYGKVNEHNAWIPRDFWLRDWEKQAILDFWSTHSREGYRRMTYMMLDADTVAVSPSTVYRVLQDAGVLHRWNRDHTSSKGQGFEQPVKPHEHWHIDISYINIHGTFYYLCSVLDGSWARGQGGPNSDADLLVVMPVDGSKRQQAVQIDLALEGIPIPIDLIVVTPDDVEKYRETIGTIIREALREGKVLYERAA